MKKTALVLSLLIIVILQLAIISNTEIGTSGYDFSSTNSTSVYFLRIYNNSGVYNYFLKVGSQIQKNASLTIITGLTQAEIITDIANVIGIVLKYKNTSFLLWSGFLRDGGEINISAPILPNSTLGIVIILGNITTTIYFHNIFPYSYYNNFFTLNTYQFEIINITKSEIKPRYIQMNTSEFYIEAITLQRLGFLLEHNNNYTQMRAYGINSTLIYTFSYFEENNIAYYNLSLFSGKFSEIKRIINISNLPIIITNLGFIYVSDPKIIQYHGNLIILENQTPTYFVTREGEIYEILNTIKPKYETFLFGQGLITLSMYYSDYPSLIEIPKNLFLNVSPQTLTLDTGKNVIILIEPNTTYYIITKGFPLISFSDEDLIISIISTFTFVALLFITKNKLNPNENK